MPVTFSSIKRKCPVPLFSQLSNRYSIVLTYIEQKSNCSYIGITTLTLLPVGHVHSLY